MGNRITTDNLDEVIRKNREVRSDLQQKAILVRTNWNGMQITDSSQLAMHILRMYGVIQVPIDDKDWSGAIFVKGGKKIPVVNTAQPRANQYYTEWNMIYHLIFDPVLLERVVEAETILEDRKAGYFAAMMLLGNLLPYYNMLSNMDFTTKVFHCIETFRVPYKAVLIALYEEAMLNRNSNLMNQVKQYFNAYFTDLPAQFRAIGLDDAIVSPSYVTNVNALSSKIQDRIRREPDLIYHQDNLRTLENIMREMNLYNLQQEC